MEAYLLTSLAYYTTRMPKKVTCHNLNILAHGTSDTSIKALHGVEKLSYL